MVQINEIIFYNVDTIHKMSVLLIHNELTFKKWNGIGIAGSNLKPSSKQLKGIAYKSTKGKEAKGSHYKVIVKIQSLSYIYLLKYFFVDFFLRNKSIT